jgi:cytidylate kinase
MEDNLPLSDKVFLMESRIINEIAEKEQSFVLVGRCGSYILEDKGCFSVYIYASHEDRIKRAIEDYKIPENKAENMLKKADKRRETFFNVNTGKSWQDKDIYSLCLNSAELGDELCAEIIVKAYQEYNKRFSE